MSSQKNVIRLRIKELAQARNISMSKLSRLADVHYNTLGKIYANPYHNVELNTLERVAKALNVRVEELYVVEDD